MIKFKDVYLTSTRALMLHKGRTILTMLGVIIGVFAVVSLVSMGIGVQNYISDQFETLGANVIFVSPGKMDFSSDPAKNFGNNKLAEKHLELINSYATQNVSLTTPYLIFGKNAQYKSNVYYSSVLGVSFEAKEIFNLQLTQGRFFSKVEQRNKSAVAVIGPDVANELFPNSESIGKTLQVEERNYEVIGQLQKKGRDWDNLIYLPYTKIKEDFDTRNFSSIAVKANSAESIDLAMQEVEFALLRDLKPDDFSVISSEDILSSIQNVLGIMTAAIGAIAGISLLVGGIGIMNIMLVSVTERIKEIGLRKALGATPKDIAIQFIIEAVLLSVGGGFIGLFLGWLASLAARGFVRTEVPLWTVGLAFGFSVIIGVVFGTYPAIAASKKDPIEALRYE